MTLGFYLLLGDRGSLTFRLCLLLGKFGVGRQIPPGFRWANRILWAAFRMGGAVDRFVLPDICSSQAT